jgi:flagellar motor switch protein FliN/FliY
MSRTADCAGRRGSTEPDEDRVTVLEKVQLDIAVVLGTTSMPVHQVLRLGRGAIIELDATEEDEVKVLANHMPIASGAVVVCGNRIAVEIRRMLPRPPERRDE